MYSKQVNASSPLRILENSIHGGLGQGNLGVVMARAGVGKTAFLVQIGLDDLMRGKDTLHIALGQNLERVQSWYDALFDDLAAVTALEDREDARLSVGRHRKIQTYADHHALTPQKLEHAVEMYHKHLGFKPSIILIDGFGWESPETSSSLRAFKAFAQKLGAELWMSAQCHRSASGDHPTKLTAPCEAYAELINVAVFLEPVSDVVTVRLLKDHQDVVPPHTHLVLHPDTMRLLSDTEETSGLKIPASARTLLSGGAIGAETEFGECAERWGLHEVTYSFHGRPVSRSRGLVELTDAELKQGEISPTYLTAQMHRAYPNTPMFQKMLQSLWHQVNTAAEVFVIGVVQADGTVKGGTGWAAELARHWDKPLYVYDQEKKGWWSWKNLSWAPIANPTITKTRFTGTGTRNLSEDGKAAIRSLFERSFGPSPR
jgi:hypothetical protein